MAARAKVRPTKTGRRTPKGAPKSVPPRTQLDALIAKFDPAVARQARAALAAMRELVPGAVELVYDNYNALAIAFAAGERMRDVALSVAVYPRWVSVFFMNGPKLPDPHGLLTGGGTHVRHVRLIGPAMLREAPLRALVAACLARATVAIDPKGKRRIVIRSISAKQRPRRT